MKSRMMVLMPSNPRRGFFSRRAVNALLPMKSAIGWARKVPRSSITQAYPVDPERAFAVKRAASAAASTTNTRTPATPAFPPVGTDARRGVTISNVRASAWSAPRYAGVTRTRPTLSGRDTQSVNEPGS